MTDEEMRIAIDRIARTADGEALYRWLQSQLMRVCTSAEAGTLQVELGRRTLARDLMGHMAKGIDESGKPGTDRPSERAVAVAITRAITSPGPRGIPRRVTASSDPFADSGPGSAGAA